MDPVSALGVAAGVVQFVDFTSKLIHRGYKIIRSEDGDILNKDSEKSIALLLSTLTSELENSLQLDESEHELTPSEKVLQQLCRECDSVAKTLLEAIEKIKTTYKRHKFEVFLEALSKVWNENAILETYSKIEKLRERLVLAILVSIREQVVLVGRQQRTSAVRTESDVRQLRNLGQKFLQQSNSDFRWERDLTDAIYNGHNQVQGEDSLAGLSSKLLSDVDKSRAAQFTDLTLKTLQYSNMIDRQEGIAEAHKDTFDFIFQRSTTGEQSWTNFSDWLEGDKSLYWIAGKAGSGKSTLMKYIYQDQRTRAKLDVWSAAKPLIIAAFFFWNAGTKLQKSKEGLLRSLLAQTLVRCEDLVPRIFPDRWEAYILFSTGTNRYWTWTELRRAFKLLIKEACPSKRFCFLIDGMDEFDGELSDLITLFKECSYMSPDVKLCVSSRPWVVFEDAFHNDPNLRLEYLTFTGVQLYVTTHLYDNAGFNELRKREPEYAADLINQIVTKSSGVFLWVSLVVQSLLLGLINGDRLSDLQRVLDSLPADLEDLFRKILDNLDPRYLEHASQLFQIVRASGHSPSLLCLSFADEEDADYCIKQVVQPLANSELLYRAQTMKRRVNSRCKGLLEVSKVIRTGTVSDPQLAYARVEYLHRTVRDFLEDDDVWAKIVAATGTIFNPYISLCRSFLLQLKCLPPVHSQNAQSVKELWELVTWCIQNAAEAERTTNQAQTQILDEVDRVASILYYSNTTNWTLPHGDDFLELAVQCQLHLYTEVKLQGRSRMTTDYMLRVALLEYRAFEQFYDRPACRRRRPSVKMVQLLLNHGGDANKYWEDVLERAPRQPTADNQLWLDIIQLLLDYSANPWVNKINFPVLRYGPIAQIINSKKRWYHVPQFIVSLFRLKRQIGVPA